MAKPMTSIKAKRALRELQQLSESDPGAAHLKADKVLCDFLETLGYGSDVVKEFVKVRKWYS